MTARAALVLAAGIGLLGQAPAPLPQAQAPQQPPPPRPPVFRAGSVLVTVDVYPQSQGTLVDGLTAEDFQVLEDGRPQTIDGLELVRVERMLSESERRDPNTVAESWAIAADPRNRVFVIYLDTPHVTVEGSNNIRRPLIDTLNSLIAPNDLFGVMTPNLQARHLSLGRRTLGVDEQLSRYWTWGERNRVSNDPEDPVEDALTRCFQYEPLRPNSDVLKEWIVEDNGLLRRLDHVLIDRRREDRVLTSFEDLVVYLTNRREARTVVLLVSDGWRLFRREQRLADEARKTAGSVPGGYWTGQGLKPPSMATTSDPAVCAQELARLAALDNAQRFRNFLTLANRANISVYAVAPSGMAVFDSAINQQMKRADPAVGAREIDFNRLRTRVESIQTLAENTDGLAVVRTNDIAGGMKRIVDDVSSYYLLTYYSTNTRNDGRYRKIEVRSKQPNLSIRARRGYMAPTESDVAASRNPAAAPPTTAEPAPRPEAVPVDAVFAPLSRLRTGAEMSVHGGVSRRDVLFASVELGSSQLVSGPFAKGADVHVVATLPGVGVAGPTSTGVNARIEAGTRGVLVLLPVPPASPGQTPAPEPAPARVWQVTATISSGADRLQERFEISWRRDGLLGDPMPYRATPATTSPLWAVADFTYRRTERIHVEWPLLLGPVDRREARLVARNGQAVPLPVTLTERTSDGQTIIAADLTLAPLAPADYAIELVVRQGSTSERRYIAFRVVR